MHIRYKGDDLLKASDMLKSGAITWFDLVYTAYQAMETAYNDETWEGQAADRFKSYYSDIHGSFAVVYQQLTDLFTKKCTAYVTEYLRVDSDNHAVIDTDELADIITHIVFRIQGASAVHNAVSTQVSNVSDITGIYYTEPGVVKTLGDMKTKVSDFQQAVWDEETHFVSDGFPEMKELLESLKKLVEAGKAVKVSSDNRSIAYDPNALTDTFKDVAAAYESSQDYLDAHETDFAENEKILQKAIDERQEELNRRKALAIGVGIVVAAVGVVATVVTCGAAGPAVAIGIGAAVGAVSSAATSMANQNIGDIYGRGKIDFGEVGKEAVIGGITGAVTSAVGLGSAKAVAATTRIANPVARVGAKAAIKTLESVGTGMINRGIETGIRKGSIKEGWNAATDLNKIAGDAAGAAVSSIVGDSVDGAYKKLGWDKVAKDKKLVDMGTAALKDQLTDGSKRFAGTLAETRDFSQAADKTFDLEAAGKTLVQTGASKATEYYVADKRQEFDSKRRDKLNDLEKAARDAKKTRMRNMAKNPEFKAEQNAKADRDAKDKYAQMYKDGVKSGNVNPEKTQKEHYVNRYYKHEADKSKNYSSYYKAARKADDKTVSKQYESMNKKTAAKTYEAIVNMGKSDYEAPQGEEHNVRQEDIDNLLKYNN